MIQNTRDSWCWVTVIIIFTTNCLWKLSVPGLDQIDSDKYSSSSNDIIGNILGMGIIEIEIKSSTLMMD